MKSLFAKKLANRLGGDHGSDLPVDKLSKRALRAEDSVLVGNSGLPTTADSLAYEPTQRLLAVGCSDGRIKLLGKSGVETTLFSFPGVPTQQLLFLLNKGVMLRVTKGGAVESWSVESTADGGHSAPLHVLRLISDDVRCVAAVSKEPYLLLGCASGAIRVASLVDASGAAVTEARAGKGLKLKLLPYQVKSQDLKASGKEVQMIATWSSARQHLLLSIHASVGAAVWDIRGTTLLATVSPKDENATSAIKSAGAVTAAAWTAALRKQPEFATGHESGDIYVWSLPSVSSDGNPGVPELQCNHRLAKGPAAGIKRLEFVTGRQSSMLVLGGQAEDEPEALTVIPLNTATKGTGASPAASTTEGDGEDDAPTPPDEVQPVKLPWLGNILDYAMVPSKGSVPGFEEIAAVATLMEGGRMFVHNLANTKPVNNSPAFQTINSNDRITCTKLFSLPGCKTPGMLPGACTLSGLRQIGQLHKAAAQCPEIQLMMAGGVAPVALPLGGVDQVYCSGYGDGLVRMWDVHSDVPHLLAVAPSPAASEALHESNERPKAVTCMEFNAELGILVTGHQRGEVRVFQYQEKAAASKLAVMHSVASTQHKVLDVAEEPGLVLKAVSKEIHGADISCITLSPSSKLVVAVDANGLISLTDITKPMVMWLQQGSNQPVVGVCVSTCPLPHPRDRSLGCGREHLPEGSLIKAIYLAAADCSATVLETDRGCLVGDHGWLRPKHPSQAVFMTLLDMDGCPLWVSGRKAGLTPSGSLESGTAGGLASGTSTVKPDLPPPAVERLKSTNMDADDDEEEVDTPQTGSPLSSLPSLPSNSKDEDMEYLAAAAAQVSCSPVKKKSVIGNLIRRKKEDKAGQQEADDAAAAGQKSGRKDRGSSEQQQHSPPTPTPVTSTASAPPSSSASPQPAITDTPSAPASLPSPALPNASYMVIGTSGYLRIYTINNVVLGDRTTLKKISINGAMFHAAAFEAEGAPGLLALVARGPDVLMQIYTLPNLELLTEISLSAAIPFQTTPTPDQLVTFAASAAIGRSGEVLLVGPGKEVMRLALATNSRLPSAPTNLYDWDLAAAAHAAHMAMETGGRLIPGVGAGAGGRPPPLVVPEKQMERAGSMLEATPSGDTPRPKNLVVGVLSKFHHGMNQALSETTKGIQNLVHKVDQDLGKLILKDGEREVGPSDHHPELHTVFETVVPEEDGSVEADVVGGAARTASTAASRPTASSLYKIDDDDENPDDHRSAARPTPSGRSGTSAGAAGRPSASRTSSTAVGVPARGGGPSSTHNTAVDERAELFGSASPTKLKVRTAEEIKAAYGRPSNANARSNELASVMNDNVKKLEERGERLNKLAERSAAIENEAADFAALAKRIADEQKNKKWWQL